MPEMVLLHGRYQDALASDVWPDAVIADPPYSERTHRGHNAARIKDGTFRRGIDYDCWTREDVHDFVSTWSTRTSGWIVVFSDDELCPVWKEELRAAGRYVFAPLPFVEIGSRVRQRGDGPSSWTTYIVVARPRTSEMASWGTLPGAYVAPKGTRERIKVPGTKRGIVGHKSQWVMRSLVRHYTRPNDLVVDPVAGGASTLIAAAAEGRRALGCELDLERFRFGVDRIERWKLENQGMTDGGTDETRSAVLAPHEHDHDSAEGHA